MTRSKKDKKKKDYCTSCRKCSPGPAHMNPLTIRIDTTVCGNSSAVIDGHENDIPTACLSSRKIRSRTRTRAWVAVSRHRASASSARPR
jgi:hypothetical protein